MLARRCYCDGLMQLNLLPHPADAAVDAGLQGLGERRSCRRARLRSRRPTSGSASARLPTRFVIPAADPSHRARTSCGRRPASRPSCEAGGGMPTASGISLRRATGRPTTSRLSRRTWPRPRSMRRPTSAWRTISPGGRSARPSPIDAGNELGRWACPRCSRRRTAPNPIGRWPIRPDKPDFHDAGLLRRAACLEQPRNDVRNRPAARRARASQPARRQARRACSPIRPR